MAQINQKTFCCSICLDLLTDPVTIPCGHSYCMNCIETYWDGEDEQSMTQCPQCRQTFTPRPVLVTSVILSDLVEQLKKTGLPAAPPDHCYAGPEDVACDVCTGRRLKAVKSCLVCVASYCESHIQPHYDAPPLKKHKQVDPTEKLRENICSHHNEVMKMFCCTDQQCICYLCSVEDHKGHDTVSAEAGRTERQRDLKVNRQRIQMMIRDKESDLNCLQQETVFVIRSADEAVKTSEKIFSELIHLMEKRRSEVKQQIRSQQETGVSRIKELQEKVEQEIAELRRKDTELEKLSVHQDDVQFLQNYPSLSNLCEPTDSFPINMLPLYYFENVKSSVSELRDKLHDTLIEEWTTKIGLFLPQPGPQTRAEFLPYLREMTMDPNTAHVKLLLSEGNKRVLCMCPTYDYPPHPERFQQYFQVLSKESLEGRCYWEVEFAQLVPLPARLRIAAAYKNNRSDRGFDNRFGRNNESWAIDCYGSSYTFVHNCIHKRVSGLPSFRIGIYLDHKAGILSFYSVLDTMSLIHRVRTTFTQPLHAGLYLISNGTTAKIS